MEYSKFLASKPKSGGSITKISRWADASSKLSRSHWDFHRPYIPPGFLNLISVLRKGLSIAVASGVISLEQVQEIQLRVRIKKLSDRIDQADIEAELISQDPNRSPSPPPVYDSTGNRTNTRAMRLRQKLDKERSELVDEILALNPTLRVAIRPGCDRSPNTTASISGRSTFRRTNTPTTTSWD